MKQLWLVCILDPAILVPRGGVAGSTVYVLSIYSLIVFYCLEKYYDEPAFLLYDSQLLCYQQTSFKIKSFQSQKYQHSTINALLHTLLNHRVFIFIKKSRYQ